MLLNDPTYVEAARVFAERIVKEGGKAPEERAAWALHEAVSRKPADSEVRVLAALYAKHKAEYAANTDAAEKVNVYRARKRVEEGRKRLRVMEPGESQNA